MRKVCVVTGSRADYGLLRWVMDGIRSSPTLDVQIIVTGMHLSPEFGLTYQEIETDGFVIDRKVESLLSSDTAVGIAKSMGIGLMGFADAYAELQPDLVVVLGDRYEIFSAAAAAMVACIPIAHVHGGEITKGAVDDAIRHAITKMSHLHFVATEEYRQRVIQLGESPEHVLLVGALGIDSIQNLPLLEKEELEESLGFQFASRNLLVTFHPVTLEPEYAAEQMSELLSALGELVDTNLIFTMPNADAGGRLIMGMIEEFVEHHRNASAFTSLGQLRYLSCVRHVDGVIGNSSSGIIEVPWFKKGTVNIGGRQTGRLRAASVIDCSPDSGAITSAIRKLYSNEFQLALADAHNPYGEGGASAAIIAELERAPTEDLLRKSFVDLNFSSAPRA